MPVTVRQAAIADERSVLRLIREARQVYLGFKLGDLKKCLDAQPFLSAYTRGQLLGFMFWDLDRPPLARLRGAGLADGWPVSDYLQDLLPPSLEALRAQGATALIYVGSEEWLTIPLQDHGFVVDNVILAYTKSDWAVPSWGNKEVLVRPARARDFPTLIALDQAAFDPLWQNTAEVFRDVLADYPHFVVAELDGVVVGYQFCSLIGDQGYLARVAVHPDYQGLGIGVRLMAEAIAFFKREGVRVITLNTQQDNQASQRLYRWFGFRLVGEEALVLKFEINAKSSGSWLPSPQWPYRGRRGNNQRPSWAHHHRRACIWAAALSPIPAPCSPLLPGSRRPPRRRSPLQPR
jgi:ribosomal-protein-alanine N-acetyltransferase